MHILLLYATTGKSTERLSRALSERFVSGGHTVTQLDIRNADPVCPSLFQGVDLIGIGSPVFHLRILDPMARFLRTSLRYFGPSAKAFVFLTYGGISTGRAFLNVLNLLGRYGIGVVGGLKAVAPHFYAKTSFPDAAALDTVEAFCTMLDANAFRVMPFNEAKRLFSYQRPAVRIVYPVARLVGKLRRLPIRIDTDQCVSCGRCVRDCPVHALGTQQRPVYDARKCIGCYRCTAVCANSAVICPVEKVQDMVRVNKKLLGCEQPGNAFLL